MIEETLLGYGFWNSKLITKAERVRMIEDMYRDLTLPQEYKDKIQDEVIRNDITEYLEFKQEVLIQERKPKKKSKKLSPSNSLFFKKKLYKFYIGNSLLAQIWGIGEFKKLKVDEYRPS